VSLGEVCGAMNTEFADDRLASLNALVKVAEVSVGADIKDPVPGAVVT